TQPDEANGGEQHQRHANHEEKPREDGEHHRSFALRSRNRAKATVPTKLIRASPSATSRNTPRAVETVTSPAKAIPSAVSMSNATKRSAKLGPRTRRQPAKA